MRKLKAAYPHKPSSSWREQAACAGQDRELWFPSRGSSTVHALTTCASCPVMVDCGYAHMSERYGIFGGLTERDRRVLKEFVRSKGGEVVPLPGSMFANVSWQQDKRVE